MKALRLTELNQGLQLLEVPNPEPGEGEVILDVKAAGLCHSDLHFMAGQIKVPRPMTLGHETAGVIVKVGTGVSQVQIGDRVAVYLGDTHAGVGSNKGEQYNAMGLEIPGISVDGGLADQVKVLARNLVNIPDAVSFADAAVATDAIATSYHAVKRRAEVQIGDLVGIIGLGGLGVNGMKITHLCGARTLVADTDSRKLEMAKKEGAVQTASDFLEFKGEQPDIVIDFVGIPATLKAAQRVVKAGGKIVLVGLGALKTEIHAFDLASREISLLGSFGSTYLDLKEVMQLLADGSLGMEIEKIGFDEVNDGMQRLHTGDVKGRLVVEM